MFRYADDRGVKGRFPTFREALSYYESNQAILRCPEDLEPFVETIRTSSYANLVVNSTRQQLLEIKQKSSTEIVVAIDFLPFHAPPGDETAHQAVYLDGHVAPGVPSKL